MSFEIEKVGAKKTEGKSGYDADFVKEGSKKREELAYASIPSLLNGSANPSQGSQTTQTAFNA